uniref:Uncharacterized protein n=1 Tax=Globodera rostochiensis TaxID=31243 RepID=A0A914I9Z9_GLORO
MLNTDSNPGDLKFTTVEHFHKVLLYRGADLSMRNWQGQNSEQVAQFAGTLTVTGVIQGHDPHNIGTLSVVSSSVAGEYSTLRRNFVEQAGFEANVPRIMVIPRGRNDSESATFLLVVSGVGVRAASHEQMVKLIHQQSGKPITLGGFKSNWSVIGS